jgi:DNA polymerase-3 subunit beta
MGLKADCPRKDLSDALSLAGNAARGTSPQPILQNYKVVANEGGLRVVACDGEMWIQRDLACMVHERGETCVQARLFSDLVGALPDGDVHLAVIDHQGMLVQHGASEYRVLAQDAEDFPELPDIAGEGELTLKIGALRGAIDSVMFAVSSDLHRQILTGVQLTYDGATLTLVATDTHRLAVKRIAQEGIGSNVSAVVPERALRAIRNLPLGDEDQVTIKFGGGRLGLQTGGAIIVAQLITGAYPNWERVVPSEHTRTWTLEADQLEETVRRVLIVAKDAANRIKFKGQGETLFITARSEEKGEAKEEVAMVAQNGDIEIAFNGCYVRDALGPIEGPGVRVEMTENSRPAVFRATDDDTYFCVIMPMALA